MNFKGLTNKRKLKAKIVFPNFMYLLVPEKLGACGLIYWQSLLWNAFPLNPHFCASNLSLKKYSNLKSMPSKSWARVLLSVVIVEEWSRPMIHFMYFSFKMLLLVFYADSDQPVTDFYQLELLITIFLTCPYQVCLYMKVNTVKNCIHSPVSAIRIICDQEPGCFLPCD